MQANDRLTPTPTNCWGLAKAAAPTTPGSAALLLVLATNAACYHGLDGGDGGDAGLADSGATGEETNTSGGADDGSDLPGAQCDEPDVGISYLQRITRIQYKNAVADLLGVDGSAADALPADEKIGKAFDANSVAAVDMLTVEAYQSVAEELAQSAIANIDAILSCDVATVGEDECAKQMIARLGRRAYSSRLSPDDLDEFVSLYAGQKAEDGFHAGLQIAIQAILQSPRFLYRVELTPPDAGAKIAILSDDEIAQRLSFFLTHSIPDDELLSAADAGELSDAEGIQKQAARLIETPRGHAVVASFHMQWLGLTDVPTLVKSSELFPEFGTLSASAKTETEAFIDHVMFADDATLTTLLTADYSIVDDKLASLYNVELPEGTPAGEFAEVTLPNERAGILTHASFLASHAHPDQASPIKRGVFVLRNIMCAPLADPPPNVSTEPPEIDPNATVRERYEQLTSGPDCVACHSQINPVGYGFGAYDAIGRRQELELGQPVDESGSLLGTPFVGPTELAGLLAADERVDACVVSQWFRFALGRATAVEDACTVDSLLTSFRSNDKDVKQLLLGIATSDAFRLRRAEAEE